MSTELEPEVVQFIISGRKVDAIKKLRELRGLGLKDSKELVDSYCSEHNVTVTQEPGKRSGGGLVFLILLGVLGYVSYNYFSK